MPIDFVGEEGSKLLISVQTTKEFRRLARQGVNFDALMIYSNKVIHWLAFLVASSDDGYMYNDLKYDDGSYDDDTLDEMDGGERIQMSNEVKSELIREYMEHFMLNQSTRSKVAENLVDLMGRLEDDPVDGLERVYDLKRTHPVFYKTLYDIYVEFDLKKDWTNEQYKEYVNELWTDGIPMYDGPFINLLTDMIRGEISDVYDGQYNGQAKRSRTDKDQHKQGWGYSSNGGKSSGGGKSQRSSPVDRMED